MSKFGSVLKKLNSVQPVRIEGSGPETLKTGKPENGPEREKYSTYLDSNLVTRLKVYAAQHRMKHHQVVEAALQTYLAATDPTDTGG